jgi:hypothetical protein
MSYRVFGKFKVSHDVPWLRNSFSKLFATLRLWVLAGIAGVSRTLAGNTDYGWETAGMNGRARKRQTAISTVCRSVDDRDLVWIGCDRFLGLNGRNRLSC